MKVRTAIRLLQELMGADNVSAKHAGAIEFAIKELQRRDRAVDFFNALGGPCAYDKAVLAFEKLVAEYAPAASGEDVLGIMTRAYRSARACGALGALTNRDGELWTEDRDNPRRDGGNV
jgi:hypothetical protein